MNSPVLHLPSISFDRGTEIWPRTNADYRKMEFGFKRLSRRALIMAGKDDIVIADKPADTEYIALLNHCGAGGAKRLCPSNTAGACLADDIAQSPELLEYIRSWHGDIETYMASQAGDKLSQMLGKNISPTPSAVTDILNDKVFFIRMLDDLGAPNIDTFIGNANAVAHKAKNGGHGPMIIRGAKSVGGSQVWAIHTEAQKQYALKKMRTPGNTRLFLIQPFLDVKQSPNVQFYVTPETVHLFGETMQSLNSDMEHTGNLFDRCADSTIREKIMSLAKELVLEAAALGLRGTLGIDFIVTEDNDVFPVEMNARHNTSTHALWFVNRFLTGDPFTQAPSGVAAYISIPCSKKLSAMEWIAALGAIAFDPGKGVGVMPYDTGGKELCAVALGKDADERLRLMEMAGEIAADL